ncbi:MAG: phosphotransferase [Acidimicrobiia bacterium]
MDEGALAGGNVGTVVRVGDTVRRATGPWTPAVHELLRHLEQVGFEYSPRVLGIDERGREILTYIEGETAISHPWPEWAWADATLAEVAEIVRSFHDAVDDFRPTGARTWRFGTGPLGPAELASGEIVCHNDIAPYNIVVRDGRVVGIIDWDLAAPAIPAWDVAFTAWTFAPIHGPTLVRDLGAPVDVGRRLRLLCDAYDVEDRAGFLDLVRRRMDASIDGIETWAAQGEPGFVRMIANGHVVRMRTDQAILVAHRDEWSAALERP